MKKKHLRAMQTLMAIVVINIVTFIMPLQIAFAATTGHFNKYTKVALADHTGYQAMQGMCISGDTMYYIKLASGVFADSSTTKSTIWAYDMTTGKTTSVYYKDASGKSTNIFPAGDLGHANDVCVRGNYMYIATCLDPGIVRYTISKSNGTTYLSARKTYSVKDKSGKPLAISGIEYASDMSTFLVKNNMDIYTATIGTSSVTLNKQYTLSKTVTLMNTAKTEVDITSYARQGIYYSNKNLYFPLYTTTPVDVSSNALSLIAIYPLSSSTTPNTVVESSKTTSIRMTSPTAYPVCFEIEGICGYQNELYFVANCANDTSYRLDMIGKVNSFNLK